jgi:hypothetical protein
MYPVDLLKVRLRLGPHTSSGRRADFRRDENPDHQPVAGRCVQRHIECYGHNIKSGGRHGIMARTVQCDNGCRWARQASRRLRNGTDSAAGPAHAVYFASYEAAKHALGGNEGGTEAHHPLAAGAQNITWLCRITTNRS